MTVVVQLVFSPCHFPGNETISPYFFGETEKRFALSLGEKIKYTIW
mgnify:CR=1 FL=1